MPAPATADRPRLRELAILAAACGIAGLASILARQDANWDLRNYHLYNPWAWLTGRYGHDIAPAQLQTFHNALLDVPLYAMVAADWSPRLIAFVLAAPAGIAAYYLWRIAALLLRHIDAPARRIAIAAALAVGLTGVNGISMIGSTMNEWPGAAVVAAALWLLLRDEAGAGTTLRTVVIAGFLVGLASGLKLTAATYAVGLAAALALRRPAGKAISRTLAFSVCALAGVAVTAGAWMALLELHYGSPLFPYFNAWLESPLLPADPLPERRFGPRTPLAWLTLPFDLLRPPAMYVGELAHRDARIPALAALALALAARKLAGLRASRGDAPPRAYREWRFVAVFLAVSFVVWAVLHAVYRYLLPLELMTGVAIAYAVAVLVPGRMRVPALLAVALLIVATTRYPNWGRTPFGEHWLEVQHPPVEHDALVVLTSDAPMAYVLTRFPPSVRHVGIESNLVRSDRPSALRALIASAIETHDGPLYQLTVADAPAEHALGTFGLRRAGDCGEVRTNLTRRVLLLCPLQRVR